MTEFYSFYKSIKKRKFNTWCKYTSRLDTYGCGCKHNCNYCYAKSLLKFRGLWNTENIHIANLSKIKQQISKLQKYSVVKIGGMTDCFQPVELQNKITYETIKLLNWYKINYLIVTKSNLVANDQYLQIYNKDLAHFQITITTTDNQKSFEYESAPEINKRILAIEKLQQFGFDISIRLSPFIPQLIDFDKLNKIKCNKILIEFLKVNHFIRKCFNIDYSDYTLKYGGYCHLPLDKKIKFANKVTGFKQKTIGEYVKEHYIYFRDNYNYNINDCCNLSIKKYPTTHCKQLYLF